MKVAVYYQDGRVVVDDPYTFSANEPFKSEGESIMTRFELRTDRLREWGIVLQVFFHDMRIDEDSCRMPDDRTGRDFYQTTLRKGRFIPLVSPDDLDVLDKVVIDGETVLWRQGGCLVDGIRFAHHEMLCLSNAMSSSVSARASALYTYLRNARPELSDEEIARMIGYKWQALRSVMADEAANAVSEGRGAGMGFAGPDGEDLCDDAGIGV